MIRRIRVLGNRRWTASGTGGRSAVALAGALALCGCAEQAGPAPRVSLNIAPASLTAQGIPAQNLRGTLDGEAFEARQARFRIARFPGRERVDLLFAERGLGRCGLPLRADYPVMWLRIPGVTALSPGELRGGQSRRSSFSIHYEERDERGWHGFTGGVALLVIDRFVPGRVEGKLHVCFQDGNRSCLKGRFRATECPREVDGDTVREGAGAPMGGNE